MLSVNIFEILSHQNIALYGINGRDALSYGIAYHDQGRTEGGFQGFQETHYGFHQVATTEENYLISRLHFIIQYKSSL